MENGHDSKGTIYIHDQQRTIEEIERNAARAATGLDSLGVRADDSIAILLRNDFAFFEVTIAAASLGAYAIPFNWHVVADELEYLLRDSGAKVIVVHADLLQTINAKIPENVEVLVVETPADIIEEYQIDRSRCSVPTGAREWHNWLSQFDPWSAPAPAMRGAMIYTSGTTGRPKAVVREPMTQSQVVSMFETIKQVFDLVPGRPATTLISGPLYHSAPNTYGSAAIRSGGTIVVQSRFKPEEFLALIERYRVTHVHMVPIMFVRLLALPEAVRSRYDLGSLVCVPHAAAPCTPEVKQAMIQWWGPVICEYYGGTESGAVVFHDSSEALRKPGTVGKPVTDGIVRIYDDNGIELSPNQIGNIYLGHRDFNDFTYRHREEERAEINRDGLITVGDIGYLDHDGYLFLCDRAKDMIISGGVNIYPAEIEAALMPMPEIRDCAVFGIPDPEFGEAVCAYIELNAGAPCDEDNVRDWLTSRVTKFKIPQKIVFAESLPREDSGKIFKRKLRDSYWASLGRKI